MNVIFYKEYKNKPVNGSLFYSFEYFVFLKKYVPDLKFYILSVNDLNLLKDIFIDKYDFDHTYLEDVLPLSLIEIPKLEINNLLILCTKTYETVKDLVWNVQNVRVYSNKNHKFLNEKSKHTFYGWYDYQKYTKKTRLKFYTSIHKTFNDRGNKIFVSCLSGDRKIILKHIGLSDSQVYTKNLKQHHKNLFANINKIVYYHNGGIDCNNRIVVEASIHNIPLEVFYNNNTNDSVYERETTIKKHGLNVFELTAEDLLIKDFVNGCNNILS